MVKIRELENVQLIEQIVKYNKVVEELFRERDRRIQLQGSEQGLLTPEEEKLKAEIVKGEISDETVQAAGTQFRISFDDKEIEEMQESREKEQEEQEQDDEIRVTQLLKLSKDQLASLQENAARVKEKSKKAK